MNVSNIFFFKVVDIFLESDSTLSSLIIIVAPRLVFLTFAPCHVGIADITFRFFKT